MIEVVLNDRLGKKVRVKCNEDDTIGDLKKLAAAQLGTRPEKIRLQKWYNVFKNHITLADYEVRRGGGAVAGPAGGRLPAAAVPACCCPPRPLPTPLARLGAPPCRFTMA